MQSLGGTVSLFLPAQGLPSSPGWSREQALSSMVLTFLSGKQAGEGASKLPGQKQSCWEQEALSVNHRAVTLVGASSLPLKWYFEGLGVWPEAPDCPQLSQGPL